jgi:integrase/recombinase XerD
MTVAELYQTFVTERRYLKNVSPNTLESYKHSFRPFAGHVGQLPATDDGLKGAFKCALTQVAAGSRLRASSVNDYSRAVNAFLRWAHDEGHIAALVRLPYLKEEQRLIPTLNERQIQTLLGWKPKTFAEQRLYALVSLLLDTGVRISEALALRRPDVDFDNLLIRVDGKGGKERLVPMSFMLRKALFRFLGKHQSGLLFPTLTGQPCHPRNILRDMHWLGKHLGITGVRFSPHTFRHTFAVHYLRSGGNQFYLMRILGHSSLEMTARYLRSVGTQDLQAVHDRLSLLSSHR